ncbi:MAG: 3-isopropylmalate dehydratase small subunit [Xanthomonadales bacterium]|nr:3-isopropylmalate dehydratase small subunit [Xanthomonadales bacterium]
MDKFCTHKGQLVPLDQANIDTDQIIPKQFLKSTERVGFGKHLFHDWRYLDNEGTQENFDFILNQLDYKGASILLTGQNFGCGSSREHAPWALQEYGFKVIIAPSFADIFYGNCINIGLLPVILAAVEVKALMAAAEQAELIATINLESQSVTTENNEYRFEIDRFHKYCLRQGVDSIDWTLASEAEITAYEKNIPDWR